MKRKLVRQLEKCKIIFRCRPENHIILPSGHHTDELADTLRLLESPTLTQMFFRDFMTRELVDELCRSKYLCGVNECGKVVAYLLPSVNPHLSACRTVYANFKEWNYLDEITVVTDIFGYGIDNLNYIEKCSKNIGKIRNIFCLFNISNKTSVLLNGEAIPILSCVNIPITSWKSFDCPLCKSRSVPVELSTYRNTFLRMHELV